MGRRSSFEQLYGMGLDRLWHLQSLSKENRQDSIRCYSRPAGVLQQIDIGGAY